MGARSPWIRLAETEKLIEAGFRECGSPYSETKCAVSSEPAKDAQTVIHAGTESQRSMAYARVHRMSKIKLAGTVTGTAKTSSHKISAREKAHLAKSSDRTGKNSIRSGSAKSQTKAGIAKIRSEKGHSAHGKAGKSSQTAKVEKSDKAGKKGTETASLKKKSSAQKHSPHAQVSKKKAAG